MTPRLVNPSQRVVYRFPLHFPHSDDRKRLPLGSRIEIFWKVRWWRLRHHLPQAGVALYLAALGVAIVATCLWWTR